METLGLYLPQQPCFWPLRPPDLSPSWCDGEGMTQKLVQQAGLSSATAFYPDHSN